MKSYLADEARRKMRDILTAVEQGEHVQLQRYSTPTAIVVPVDWYRIAQAIHAGVEAATRDSDGKRLPDETTLTVGDLHSAIGEAAISELEKS